MNCKIQVTSHQLSFGIHLPWSGPYSYENHIFVGGCDSAMNKEKKVNIHIAVGIKVLLT